MLKLCHWISTLLMYDIFGFKNKNRLRNRYKRNQNPKKKNKRKPIILHKWIFWFPFYERNNWVFSSAVECGCSTFVVLVVVVDDNDDAVAGSKVDSNKLIYRFANTFNNNMEIIKRIKLLLKLLNELFIFYSLISITRHKSTKLPC